MGVDVVRWAKRAGIAAVVALAFASDAGAAFGFAWFLLALFVFGSVANRVDSPLAGIAAGFATLSVPLVVVELLR